MLRSVSSTELLLPPSVTTTYAVCVYRREKCNPVNNVFFHVYMCCILMKRNLHHVNTWCEKWNLVQAAVIQTTAFIHLKNYRNVSNGILIFLFILTCWRDIPAIFVCSFTYAEAVCLHCRSVQNWTQFCIFHSCEGLDDYSTIRWLLCYYGLNVNFCFSKVI